MYVITHQRNDSIDIVLGPVQWSSRFMSAVIQNDLELNSNAILNDSDESRVPFELYPGIWVRRVTQVFEEILYPNTQAYDTPTWTFTEDNNAIANYSVIYKNVDIIRSELRQKIADKRYEKETSGFTFEIQNQKVKIPTDRNSRLSILNGIPGYWKFNTVTTATLDTFDPVTKKIVQKIIDVEFEPVLIQLSSEELASINLAIKAHVQDAYDWEASKYNIMNSFNQPEDFNTLEI